MLLAALMISCLPYEDVHKAIDDPEEASYAFGTLNGASWEAAWDIDVFMQIRKAKILLGIQGILSFNSDLYWDEVVINKLAWGRGVTQVDFNKDRNSEVRVGYNVIEYDVIVARYELDKTQENHLKMSPMWGSADYTGELEVHLVKTWSVDYAPPTPDTLHLVVKEFRATRLK